MFNRPYIKELAKYRMSGRMGNAIIVALLVTILGGQASSGFTFRFNQINQNGHNILMTFFPLFAFLGFFCNRLFHSRWKRHKHRHKRLVPALLAGRECTCR